MENISGYGKRIRELRGTKTQEEIAQLLQLQGLKADRGTVARWELEVQMPKLTYVYALSRIFGVTTDYIIYGDGKAADIFEYLKNQKMLAKSNGDLSAEEIQGMIDYAEFIKSKKSRGIDE